MCVRLYNQTEFEIHSYRQTFVKSEMILSEHWPLNDKRLKWNLIHLCVRHGPKTMDYWSLLSECFPFFIQTHTHIHKNVSKLRTSDSIFCNDEPFLKLENFDFGFLFIFFRSVIDHWSREYCTYQFQWDYQYRITTMCKSFNFQIKLSPSEFSQ